MLNKNNSYINLMKTINNNFQKYITNDDYESILNYEKVKSAKKEPYKYHLDVLPQPYYGNITDPKVLFLAKNPSYEDGVLNQEYKKINDITDTSDFVSSNVTFERYITNLENVNIFEKEPDNNDYFINCAWHWWHKNVIGENSDLKLNIKDFGCINLNPYHSREYNAIKANRFKSQNELKEQLKKTLNSVNLIIVVWGYSAWTEFINEDKDLNSLFFDEKKNIIVLNKMKKSGKRKYGRGIVSLKNIFNHINEYDDAEYREKLRKAQQILTKLTNNKK